MMKKNHPIQARKILKQLMFTHNLTESQLAKSTGVSISNLSRLLNNPYCNPTINTLIPIAQYFNVSVSELIGDNKAPLSSQCIDIESLHLKFVDWLKNQVQ